MATSLTVGSTAPLVFDSFASDPSAEAVSGIGDQAMWFGANSIFLVRKGDKVMSMSAGTGDQTDDEARGILEGLAHLAADDL